MAGNQTRLDGSHIAVEKIDIRNIGAVDRLRFRPPESDFLQIIYGMNGAGKTTVLECLSLLGHLPCLPIVWSGVTAQPDQVTAEPFPDSKCDRQTESLRSLRALAQDERSLLRLAMQKPGQSPVRLREFVAQRGLSGHATAEDFLKAFGRSMDAHGRAGWGAVGFRVRVGDESVGFVVVANLENEPTVPLTGFLSRERAGEYSSDTDLEKNLVIVGFCAEEDALSMLVRGIARGRTFSLGAGSHQTMDEIATARYEEIVGSGDVFRVSYVNTDLNDFGRGNDLRESPKDLKAHMNENIVDRFRFEFEESGGQRPYKYLSELNEAFREILPSQAPRLANAHASPSQLTFTTFERNRSLKIRRGEQSEPVEADWLSAGENEIFFILMMCWRVSSSDGGLVLLDEPDLHLAGSARARFYGEILSICRSLQIIIVTHSYSPIAALRGLKYQPSTHAQVLYRAKALDDEEDEVTELRLNGDDRFIYHLKRSDLSGSSQSRAVHKRLAAQFYDLSSHFRASYTGHFGGSLNRHMAEWGSILASIALIVLPVVASLAFINDVFDAFGLWSIDEVVKGVHRWLTFVGLLALSILLWSRLHSYLVSRAARKAARHRPEPPWQFGQPGPGSINVQLVLINVLSAIIVGGIGWLIASTTGLHAP